MLRQEMGWFDDKFNSTGALTTRLASDAAQVQGATGSRLGVLIQVIFSLILSVAIAFAHSWSLTLIIIGFVPIVMFAGALQIKTVTGFTKLNKKDLEEAGKISVESIENIRTVAGLNREDTFYELYSTQVDRIHRRAHLATFLAGLLYGFSQGILIFGYAIVFRYGAFQVTQPANSTLYAPFFNVFMYEPVVYMNVVHAQFLMCITVSVCLSTCLQCVQCSDLWRSGSGAGRRLCPQLCQSSCLCQPDLCSPQSHPCDRQLFTRGGEARKGEPHTSVPNQET